MRNINRDLIVITSFLKKCNSEFELNFNENEIQSLFEAKLSHNDLDQSLDYFAENNVLTYIRGGEDGFAEEFNIKIKKEACFHFIQNLYIDYHSELIDKINKQNAELKDIYGFLPESVVLEINDSKTKLKEIVNSIKDSEFLKPLEPKIKEINDYLEKTEKVIKNYENIYLNVIKPIKEEGKQGIRATATWAILSIIITTLLSFYFSYKTSNQSPKSFDSGSNLYQQKENEIKPNTDLNGLEDKVNFIVRELIGLNTSYEFNKNLIEIKYLDEKVVFTSKTDTVTMECYAFNDYKTETACYSSADFRFYINNRMVTSSMLRDAFHLKTRINRENYIYNQMTVIEGDTIQFNSQMIVIDKIYSKDSECYPIGDNYDAVRIRKIN